MKFRKILLAAVVAASVSFANTASAHTYEWSCNSDGHIHLLIDGGSEFKMDQLCGPGNPTSAIAIGNTVNLVISGKTQVSATGRAFLNAMEKSGTTVSPNRVPIQGARAAPKPMGQTETIQLNPADVGPGLAALLTKVAPDWRQGGQTPDQATSNNAGENPVAGFGNGNARSAGAGMGAGNPGGGEGAGGASSKSPMAPKYDLKVRIVIQTSPTVYVPVNVPPSTVVSVPPSPPSIINCPAIAGVALPTTTDCFEIGLTSNTNIKLVAPANLAPNAQFYQWTDIPGSSGLSISNSCTYSSYMPNMNCTMAGSRFIQAVYKCNDTYVYDIVSQQCKKSGGKTACQKYMPNVTACGLGLRINRAKKGPNTYTVTVVPSAIIPSVNTAPSSASNCVNIGSSALQTSCSFYYNAYPTSVTLTATSSSGSLPSGFAWSGGVCSGSSAICTVSVIQGVPVNVNANFPQ